MDTDDRSVGVGCTDGGGAEEWFRLGGDDVELLFGSLLVELGSGVADGCEALPEFCAGGDVVGGCEVLGSDCVIRSDDHIEI